MNDHRRKDRFEELQFGTIKDFCVECDERIPYNEPFFGSIRFERETMLVLPAHEEIVISFSTPRHKREAMSLWRDWSSLGLPIVKVTPTDSTEAGTKTAILAMAIPARGYRVTTTIAVSAGKAQVSSLMGASDDRAYSELLDQCVLRTPDGNFLIRIAPNFFGTSDADIVKLLLGNGTIATFRLLQHSSGGHYLELTDGDNDHEMTADLKRLHFIRIDEPLTISDTEEWIPSNDVNVLEQAKTPLLDAWHAYTKIKKDQNEALNLQRNEHPLMYDRLQPADRRFQVHITNWSEPRTSAWCGECVAGNHQPYMLNASVKMYSSRDVDDGIAAKLVSVDAHGYGIIEIEKGKSIPPDMGRIAVATDPSMHTQAERRKAAIQRLQQGEVALANLLDIISDPSSAPVARHATAEKGMSEFGRSQKQAIQYALGNQSIITIQGPPGTGKTKVIVEVIRRLCKDSRKREDGPLRILISSTQNKAVENVVEKLAVKGVLIEVIQSSLERNREGGAQRRSMFCEESQRVLQKVWENLSNDPVLLTQVEFLREFSSEKRLFLCWPQDKDALLVRMGAIVDSREMSAKVRDAMNSEIAELHRLRSNLQEAAGKEVCDRSMQAALDGVLARCIAAAGTTVESVAMDDVCSTTTELKAYSADPMIADMVERLYDFATKFKRAVRNKLGDEAERLRSELITALESAARRRYGSDRPYEARILREIDSVRQACLNKIEAIQVEHRKTASGVVEQWHRALDENPGLWQRLTEHYAEITGATCQMASPQRGVTESYHHVIIDEAARSELFDLLIPMTLGEKIVLVGDQNQLPPFIEENIAQQLEQREGIAAATLTEDTLFKLLYENLPVENRHLLDVQYRSHPAIGNAISKAFYEGRIRSGCECEAGPEFEKWKADKEPEWSLFDNAPLVWLDSARVTPVECARRNDAETELALRVIASVIEKEREKATATGGREKKAMGIIAFYKEQVESLRSALESIPDHARYTEVDTVDAFQGKEFPIVVLLCSRHNNRGSVGFLQLPNRINVAVSRAEKQLVIIGSKATLLHERNGSEPFKKFYEAGRELLDREYPYAE